MGHVVTAPVHEAPLSILLFGQDQSLVDTRRWVLEKAGFCVHAAMSPTDLSRIAAEEQIGLFLLCDSLAPDVLLHALALVRFRWPVAKRLVVTPYSFSAEFDPAEEVFSALEGPEKLIETIRTFIASARASVSSGLSA